MPIDNGKYMILLLRALTGYASEIGRTLQESGFRFQQADGLDGQEISAKEPPDLIVVDAGREAEEYPRMLRRLKSRTVTSAIPLLFCVSVENDDFISQCLTYDDTDFIMSPFSSRELVLRLQRQLLLLRARRTIQRQHQKLKDTLEARDKLYSVIAHDLRAPISTIKMINAAIQERRAFIRDEQTLNFFQMINATTEEAFDLLENLLRWTRNRNGKTKIYAAEFNMTLAVRQVVALFKPIAGNKEITLQNRVDKTFYIYADEDMVKTVLRNLLSNAVKFTYPGGVVEISVQQTPNGVLTSVRDNGKGIPRELQARLLKNNQYITTFGTRNEKGSGLGLALCRDFIEMNKGKFFFSSREGVGSTFSFLLPACAPEHRLALADIGTSAANPMRP